MNIHGYVMNFGIRFEEKPVTNCYEVENINLESAQPFLSGVILNWVILLNKTKQKWKITKLGEFIKSREDSASEKKMAC